MNIKEMIRGWFIGNFSPTAFKTDQCEVGIKKYNKGDFEDFHYHKIATEITVIISGKVQMNNKIYKSGDIIIIKPNEGTDFKALNKVTNVVVKIPGVLNDKYIA